MASFGTLSGSPTARVNNLYEVADNLSHQARARTRCAWAWTSCTTTRPSPIRARFAAATHFRRWRTSSAEPTTTRASRRRSGTPWSRRRNPNVGFYVQDEWKLSSRLTLNLGVRYDLQFLKTHRDRYQQRFARAPASPGRRSRARRTVVRGSFGLFYDRVPLRALANALLSSNNTTDHHQRQPIEREPFARTDGRAGHFPNILPATALPAGVLVNFTTMNPHMQNAYSRAGQPGDRAAVGRAQHAERGLPASARTAPDRFGQSERASVRGVGQQQRLPSESGLRQQQPVLARWRIRTTTGCTFRSCSGRRSGAAIACRTRSRRRWTTWASFSSARPSIFPTSGRTTDGATTISGIASRVDGAIRLGHGFELSGMMQYYSALPLNITSGVTTIQGTAGRPIVNGAFIGRNAGTGNDFFNVSTRVSRSFRISEKLRDGSAGGGVQRAQSPEQPDEERRVRGGRVPG